MKKKWLYIVIGLCSIISFIYDKQIISFIAQSRISCINGFVIWITNPWTAITIFLIMTTLFLWKEKKRDWILPLWASVGITGVVIVILKATILRPRPFELLGLTLIKGADYTFEWWNASFPSLHAAALFSLLPILDKEFPKLKWFWIILASLIAFSRLYTGVHYLSDVLVGCLIGLFIGYSVLSFETKYKVFKKLRKKKFWK